MPKSKKLLKFVLDDGTGEDRIILSGIHAYYEPEELVGKTLIAITNLPPRKMMGIDSCGMLLSAIHQEEGEEKLRCKAVLIKNIRQSKLPCVKCRVDRELSLGRRDKKAMSLSSPSRLAVRKLHPAAAEGFLL